MQNRTDRIHFPVVDSVELWDGVTTNISSLCSPIRESPRVFVPAVSGSPVFSTTPQQMSNNDPDAPMYFKDREREGLVTPAKTPSDILFRGPLFGSSSVDEESGNEEYPPIRIHLGQEPNTAKNESLGLSDQIGCRPDWEKRVEYHRDRQRSIRRSISEYERKMSRILNWHVEEEKRILEEEASGEDVVPRE